MHELKKLKIKCTKCACEF